MTKLPFGGSPGPPPGKSRIGKSLETNARDVLQAGRRLNRIDAWIRITAGNDRSIRLRGQRRLIG